MPKLEELAIPSMRDALDIWLKEHGKIENLNRKFSLAKKLVKDVKRPSIDDIHLFFEGHFDELREELNGDIIISALYLRSPEKEIIFNADLPKPARLLAYRLPPSKAFVATSPVWFPGNYARGPIIMYSDSSFPATSAKSVVVNYGHCVSLNKDSSALVLNMGESEEEYNPANSIMINFGKYNSRGGLFFGASGFCLINCGETLLHPLSSFDGALIAIKNPDNLTEEHLEQCEFYLTEEDCKKIPELRDYFSRLHELLDRASNNYRHALSIPAAYDPSLRTFQEFDKKVQSDIEKIIQKAGHDFRFDDLY